MYAIVIHAANAFILTPPEIFKASLTGTAKPRFAAGASRAAIKRGVSDADPLNRTP
jgi:hypothetical protein